MTGEHNDSEAVCIYKTYRNLYNRLVRLTKSNYYGELFERNKGDNCSTWSSLNEIIGRILDKTSCTSMKINGQQTNDPKVISTKFCDYFTKVGHDMSHKYPRQICHSLIISTVHIHIPYSLIQSPLVISYQLLAR